MLDKIRKPITDEHWKRQPAPTLHTWRKQVLIMGKYNMNYQKHVHNVLKELRRQTKNGIVMHHMPLSTHSLYWCSLWLWHDSYWTYLSEQEYYTERALLCLTVITVYLFWSNCMHMCNYLEISTFFTHMYCMEDV